MNEKNHKIAFIVNTFPAISETFILNQVIDLIDRGCDVKIYSFNKRQLHFMHQAIGQYKLLEKTNYYESPFSRGVQGLLRFVFFFFKNFNVLRRDAGFLLLKPKTLRSAVRNESISQSVAHFLNQTCADIVHAHFGPRGAVVANLIAKGVVSKFKFVTTFHGFDLNPSYVDRYKKEYKNIFRFADALTVNSKYLESILLEVCPNPKNLFVLPVGLRTDMYRKTSRNNNGTTSDCIILFCGRFVEFKGPDVAVQIIGTLVKRGIKNVRLRMIGEGRLKNHVKQMIENLSLKEFIVLLGAQSQEQVIAEMNKADIFLLPGVHEKETGRAETQGLVIQEAQAMEIPVVVSDAGGAKYGVLDGTSGFIVKQRDIEAFADKLELLIRNEPLRHTMATAGREFVVRTFDNRILGDELMKIYDGI